MKTKYVRKDLELKTHEELFKALLDGFILLYEDKDHPGKTLETGWAVKLVNGILTSNRSVPLFDDPEEWEVWEEMEVNWWNDFQEGDKVICWVSDYDEKAKEYMACIIKVPGGSYCYFASSCVSWRYATPVTKKDVEEFNGKFI